MHQEVSFGTLINVLRMHYCFTILYRIFIAVNRHLSSPQLSSRS